MAKRPATSRPERIRTIGTDVAPPQPTARHPSPIPFSRILGQDRAIALLQKSLKSGRVHHAWIFHGPQGVGKFTTALAFASLLLDPTTQPSFSGEFECDPDSHVQRLIRTGCHPDLHVITKELARFSEDRAVREQKQITISKDVIDTHLLVPAALAPSIRNQAAAAKVFIIDEAELLDRWASHAPTQASILKTMEEPPDRTVIILVTSSEERLLPTIRSRCQRVSFAPLSTDSMMDWIKREPEASTLSTAARDWMLRFSAGSPGTFVLAMRGGLHEWHLRLEPLLAQLEQGRFPPNIGSVMAELVKEWSEAWVKTHENASKEAANKAGSDWIFRLLSEHFRSRLRDSVDSIRPGLESPFLVTIDLIQQAEQRVDANVNSIFVFDALAADIAGAFAGEHAA